MISKQDVQDFCNLLALWKHSYRSIKRTYIATRIGDQWIMRHGIIVFSPENVLKTEETIFVDTANLVAGYDSQELTKECIDSFVTNLQLGNVSIIAKEYELKFTEGEIDSYFSRVRPREISGSRRLPCLTLHGRTAMSSTPRTDALDLELQTCGVPFDGMKDLVNTLGLQSDPMYSNTPKLEIILVSPAYILEQSRIDNDTLAVEIHASPHILRNEIKIGFRAVSNHTTHRVMLNSPNIVWELKNDWLVGKMTFYLPETNWAQSFLIYRDEFLHSWWITDPARVLNRRAGVFGLYDKDKQALRELLFPPRTQARNIEHGVALLLGLHGFVVFKLGEIEDDAPDLLAETISGKLLIIECTIDLPDKNDKLSKLIQRTAKINAHFSKVSQTYSDVLAVLVTSLTEAEAKTPSRGCRQRRCSTYLPRTAG